MEFSKLSSKLLNFWWWLSNNWTSGYRIWEREWNFNFVDAIFHWNLILTRCGMLIWIYLQLSSVESWPTETSSSGPSSSFANNSSINWRTFSRWLRDTNAARLSSSENVLKRVIKLIDRWWSKIVFYLPSLKHFLLPSELTHRSLSFGLIASAATRQLSAESL